MTKCGSDWRSHLARQVEDLGPMPRGRYLPAPDATDEQVRGERLLDPEFLRAAIDRAGRSVAGDGPGAVSGSDDPRVRDPRMCASRMSRQYWAALTTVALVGLANGVGIDLSPAWCTVIFRNDLPSRLALDPGHRAEKVLRCAQRPTSWPVSGPVVATVERLREHVWTNLYARNLRPMIAIMAPMVRAPERLLWTNAAEWVAVVMDAARDYLDPVGAASVVAEGRALLDADRLPGFAAGPNPLRGLVEWVPFGADGPWYGIQTRRLCCLVYMHADRDGRLCRNCPLLPLSDRAALVREALDEPLSVGMENLSSPAQRRAIEVGLRLRRHR